MKHLLLARQRHYSNIMLYSKVTKCWHLCDVVNWKLESYCPQIYDKKLLLTTDGEKATNITIQLPNNLSSSLPILLPPFNNERNTTTAYETMSIRTDESQITKRTCCKLSDWVSRCNSGSINYTEFDFQEVLERSSNEIQYIVCGRQFVKKPPYWHKTRKLDIMYAIVREHIIWFLLLFV